MNTPRTLAEAVAYHRSALNLAKLLPRHALRALRYGSLTLSLLSGALAVLAPYSPWPESGVTALGSSLFFATSWLLLTMLYAYHNARYYFGLNSLIGLPFRKTAGATYEVADIVSKNTEDLSGAFASHPLSRRILLRAGVPEQAIETFLKSERSRISASMVPITPDQIFTTLDLGLFLLQQDTGLQQLLNNHAVEQEHFIGAVRWVVGLHLGNKRRNRWWSKDNLSAIKGIGRELSYGRAYNLERFLRSLSTSSVFSTIASSSAYAAQKVTEVEEILAREKASNVLLIGEPGVGKMDVVISVASRIEAGSGLDAVSGKHIVTLDSDRLFAQFADKQSFEIAFMNLLAEAAAAGNIIVVIENISSFLREAAAIGAQATELLDPYLADPALHIIATDSPGEYHNYLQPLGAFTRRFAEVLIEAADLSSTTTLLQSLALPQEQKHHTLFTYQAMTAIATAADRYIVDGVMPDKAVTLLSEIAVAAGNDQQPIITDTYVYTYVGEKTGIPTGPITDEEKDKLLHLEDKLHQKVIGQDRAITAIAKTMRRARAGIQQADKPIGSFLFLGPTGVGKTETAKALAATFFKSESDMHRIDMSEFSGPDALERLIGNYESNGVLGNMLQEHPYSVVLLDEFEKAAQPVHDLFLQILDEGVFTNGRGEQVNARNTIIIATSNAGSDLIIKTIEQRQDLGTLEPEIINYIIKQGIYRPELINRFDDTIIFEPLTKAEQGSVAQLQLGDLYERIKDRGFSLVITPDLVEVLVEKGYDPQFGARPMQRVVQDLIEEKIAQKIISGEVQKGETIALNKADFSEAELAL